MDRRSFLATGGDALRTIAALQASAGLAVAASCATPGRVRDAYSLAKGLAYLNHASIGTIPRSVHRAHVDYLALCESNPWLHMWGGAWDKPLEEVRTAAARRLGCSPSEVALTRNTTEGFNLLASGLPLGPSDEVLFSNLNHPGASVPWEHAARRRGFKVRRFHIPLRDVPSMTAERLTGLHRAALSPKTRVLVLPHVDNIVGMRHPVASITRTAREAGVRWIAADGAQSVGMIPTDVGAMGVDFFCASPHKWVQSPKGTGLFHARKDALDVLEPLIVTAGQSRWKTNARRFENYGTRDLPAVLALGHALEFQRRVDAQKGFRARTLASLRERLMRGVDAVSGLRWASPSDPELASSVHAVAIVKGNAAAMATELHRRHGVIVRPFQVDGMALLRVSPNVQTDPKDLDRFLKAAAS